MRKLLGSLAVLLLILISACAPLEHGAQKDALWNKYDTHCQEHAENAASKGSPEVEAIYRECMNYFVRMDVECAYCVVKK